MQFKVPAHFQDTTKKKKVSIFSFLPLVLILVTISIFLSIIIRYTLVYPVIVRNDSMEPTIISGKRIFIAYKYLTEIQRGDIVYIEHGSNKEELLCRIIGLGGEKVSIVDTEVYINNRSLTFPDGKVFPIIKDSRVVPASILARDNVPEVTIPKNEYFCLTDNRKYLVDSRFRGSFSKDSIVGKAVYGNIFFKGL